MIWRGNNKASSISLALLVAVLFGAGCSTATEIANDSAEPSGQRADETVAPDEPPDPADTADPAEPTVLVEDSTPEPVPDRWAGETDIVLGIDTAGRYGYVATHSAWSDPADCDGPARQALAVVDLESSRAEDIVIYQAGLLASGDVQQLIFSPAGRAAALMSCGSGDGTVWIQTLDFGSQGEVVAAVRLVAKRADDDNNPFLIEWETEETIRYDIYLQEDPDDFESAYFEARVISAVDGELLSAERSDFFDEGETHLAPAVTTPAGDYTYREIVDPNGQIGCEGFGVARTIEVDDSTGPRPAFTDPSQVFSNVADLHFGPSGLIAWTTGCEGFTSAFVGRIGQRGAIVDAHLIDVYTIEGGDLYAEYQSYRLTSDGALVALGIRFGPDDDGVLTLFRYDLAADPQFVLTAFPTVQIDYDNPLAETMSGEGNWYAGSTRGQVPACGATTIYGDTPDGPARAFATGFEIDAVVDFDVSQTRTTNYEDGTSFSTRAVVISTECPGEYVGRRLWIGAEPERVRYGLYLERADLVEVAEVLSVREVPFDDDSFGYDILAEVVMLDGSITEVALVRAK